MAGGEHELIGIWMLGPAVIVPEATRLGSGEVGRDIERCVSQRTAEMARLGIIAEQRQGHAGHVPDIFKLLPLRRQL